MKQFDSRNIDRRAEKLLSYHIGMLEDRGITFSPEGGHYYLYRNEGEDYLKIGYNKRKKLLSRTFNLEFKSVIHNIQLPENLDLKLQFKGFPNIIDASFVRAGKSKASGAMFADRQLLNAILEKAKKVEVGFVRIRYNCCTQIMEITVCPYSGAYLWVIFPPAFYDMRLKADEVWAIYQMAETITDYAQKKLS